MLHNRLRNRPIVLWWNGLGCWLRGLRQLELRGLSRSGGKRIVLHAAQKPELRLRCVLNNCLCPRPIVLQLLLGLDLRAVGKSALRRKSANVWRAGHGKLLHHKYIGCLQRCGVLRSSVRARRDMLLGGVGCNLCFDRRPTVCGGLCANG
jgi:hypothetical protein